MLSTEEAAALISGAFEPFPAETCRVEQAAGRILREDLRADRPLPPYDRATMDGIALRATAAGNGPLTIEATQYAGESGRILQDPEGGCVRIMTGGVLPAGCDSVVPVEEIDIDEPTGSGTGHATCREPDTVVPGRFVHPLGSDRAAGDLLVAAGRRLQAPQLAIAAAVGLDRVQTSPRPHIAVISTGDELVEPGRPLAAHQVRPSSTFGIVGALEQIGYQAERLHLPDDPEALRDGLESALSGCDGMVLSGGVSKGTRDFLPDVLEDLGVKPVFHRVAQRPGRPMWFGVTGGPAPLPVFALPGNPVSTLVCFVRLVRPALLRALGATPAPTPRVVLDEDIDFQPALTLFNPVRVHPGEDGTHRAVPVRINTSGDFSALGETDGFVELVADSQRFPAGTVVPYFPWETP